MILVFPPSSQDAAKSGDLQGLSPWLKIKAHATACPRIAHCSAVVAGGDRPRLPSGVPTQFPREEAP